MDNHLLGKEKIFQKTVSLRCHFKKGDSSQLVEDFIVEGFTSQLLIFFLAQN